MAKKTKTSGQSVVSETPPAERRKWEVDDALRTLTRAQEIEEDASLMKDVRKRAAEQAAENIKIAGDQAKRLIARGLISNKAAKSLKSRE